MKPLPAVPLTDEDGFVLIDVFERIAKRWAGRRWDRYAFICTESDRRDAALMLQAQQQPQKILFGPVTDPPWLWVRMRGGVSFGDFLRDALT